VININSKNILSSDLKDLGNFTDGDIQKNFDDAADALFKALMSPIREMIAKCVDNDKDFKVGLCAAMFATTRVVGTLDTLGDVTGFMPRAVSDELRKAGFESGEIASLSVVAEDLLKSYGG
jgi:hypothetical protein